MFKYTLRTGPRADGLPLNERGGGGAASEVLPPQKKGSGGRTECFFLAMPLP